MRLKIFKLTTLIAVTGAVVGALSLSTPFPTQAAGGASSNALVLEGGQSMVTDVEAAEDLGVDRIYSGWRFRSPETQALQLDDFENPAFTAVDTGETLWNTVDGNQGKSCADCHQEASVSMKGVRAQFPKWNAKLQRPHTMETQINECRTERMGAEEWKWEAKEMLAMTAYVGLQSRGMPVNIDVSDPGMAKWVEKGKDVYFTRVGQLNMSCANCHVENYGNMIRADHLSQGQINGFPVYRLKWGGIGSAQRRFKGCMANIRATPYKVGGDEFTALETYLASRGNGLSVETPSVRN